VDAGHAVEAELVREACQTTLAVKHFSLYLLLVALTSDRICRGVVQYGDVVVVKVSLSVHRSGSQIVVSLNDRYRLAEVKLLPAVGSATGSVADAAAVLEDRGPKGLQEESLVLAPVSL
jgi:hypothetical protein